MDLLEYQAKELFREMGIPVLPSQRIDHPSDLKGLKIPYPIALKSQVRAGGRGKAGGVKFVATTIDAVAAAQTIFNLPIMGEYPQVLLAESKYNADREFYLAVVLDRNARRPVLLGSVEGGIEAEASFDRIQQVVVDRQFSPFYARRLAVKMGLKGELIQSVSAVVEKMYHLFVDKDLDLVEINPLGISASGEVMALDGKISANDEALGRHPEIATLARMIAKQVKTEDVPALPFNQNFVQLDGNVAIICNGAGLTMATLDLVCFAGGDPACFLNIWPTYCESNNCVIYSDSTPELLRENVEQSLELVGRDKKVKVILVNVIGSAVACEAAVTAVETYMKRREVSLRGKTPLHIVLRLVGAEEEKLKQRLSALKLHYSEDLEQAAKKAVDLANL